MEIYSAHHSDTVEDLLRWPWRRFDRFYKAFMQRRQIESLERRKEDMISALWANSNYDDDKGSRKSAIEEINANFEEVVEAILNPYLTEEEDIDEDNPFFSSGKSAMKRLHGDIEEPIHSTGTVDEAVKSDQILEHLDIDQ